MIVKLDHFLGRGENKKYLKPPPRFQVLRFKRYIPLDEVNFESTSHLGSAAGKYFLFKFLCGHLHSVRIKLINRDKVRNKTVML